MGRRTHKCGWPLAALAAVMLVIAADSVDLAAKEGGSQAETSAQTIVQQLNTTLLDVMQSADVLGYRGRYEKLDPVLRSTFDFAFMAKIAVGRAWNDLDETERDLLVERFAEMSVATFASRFDGYGGERFEIVGEKPGPRDTVIVDDRIVRPDDPSVGLNFVLKARGDQAAGGTPVAEENPLDGGGWRIIDVMLDGKFSELARQRSEFSAVLKNGGYEELIAALDQRIADLAGEG